VFHAAGGVPTAPAPSPTRAAGVLWTPSRQRTCCCATPSHALTAHREAYPCKAAFVHTEHGDRGRHAACCAAGGALTAPATSLTRAAGAVWTPSWQRTYYRATPSHASTAHKGACPRKVQPVLFLPKLPFQVPFQSLWLLYTLRSKPVRRQPQLHCSSPCRVLFNLGWLHRLPLIRAALSTPKRRVPAHSRLLSFQIWSQPVRHQPQRHWFTPCRALSTLAWQYPLPLIRAALFSSKRRVPAHSLLLSFQIWSQPVRHQPQRHCFHPCRALSNLGWLYPLALIQAALFSRKHRVRVQFLWLSYPLWGKPVRRSQLRCSFPCWALSKVAPLSPPPSPVKEPLHARRDTRSPPRRAALTQFQSRCAGRQSCVPSRRFPAAPPVAPIHGWVTAFVILRAMSHNAALMPVTACVHRGARGAHAVRIAAAGHRTELVPRLPARWAATLWQCSSAIHSHVPLAQSLRVKAAARS